jgi:hypothetical protein
VAIRYGSDPTKVAVIGQGMEAVDTYAKSLRERGIEPTLFTSDKSMPTIPPSAREEWDALQRIYGEQIPDDVLKSSKMYEFNESWATNISTEGYTVINIGNPLGRNRSIFFEMEQRVLFSGE